MTLTPSDCREARRKLGLSAAAMARAMGLADGKSIRRFEAPGDAATARRPQGPAAVLYRLILAGRVRAQDLAPPSK